MAKYNRNEQEALFKAIELIHAESGTSLNFLPDLCSLYDKLSGVKYSRSKNTYEFITQKGTKK